MVGVESISDFKYLGVFRSMPVLDGKSQEVNISIGTT